MSQVIFCIGQNILEFSCFVFLPPTVANLHLPTQLGSDGQALESIRMSALVLKIEWNASQVRNQHGGSKGREWAEDWA